MSSFDNQAIQNKLKRPQSGVNRVSDRLDIIHENPHQQNQIVSQQRLVRVNESS